MHPDSGQSQGAHKRHIEDTNRTRGRRERETDELLNLLRQRSESTSHRAAIMLSAAQFEWSELNLQDGPSPRSGHSLTVVKAGVAYMFGE